MLTMLTEDPVERILCGWDYLQKGCVLLYLYVSTSTGTVITLQLMY